MTPTIAFLLGWLCGSVVMASLIVAYYIRARRRVAAIQASIAQYQLSQSVVGEAVNKVFNMPVQGGRS